LISILPALRCVPAFRFGLFNQPAADFIHANRVIGISQFVSGRSVDKSLFVKIPRGGPGPAIKR
jgi:hypothetical protein